MVDATSSGDRLRFFEKERDRYGQLAAEAAAYLRDLQRKRGLSPVEVNDSGGE